MHNRVSENVTFEKGDLCLLDFFTIVPITAIVLALGIYPNFLLERTDATVRAAVKPAETVADADKATVPAAPVPQVGPPGQPAPGAPQAVPQGAVPPEAVPQGAAPPEAVPQGVPAQP